MHAGWTRSAIQAFKSKGWSKRRIARELQIDRQTVRKYLRAASNKLAALSTSGAAPADADQKPSDQNHPLSTLGNLEVWPSREEADPIQETCPTGCTLD